MKTVKEFKRERRNAQLVDRLGQQKAARSANQSRFLGKELEALKDVFGSTKPFCYVEYKALVYDPSKLDDLPGIYRSTYDNLVVSRNVAYAKAWLASLIHPTFVRKKRPFSSYAKAFTHLTALKLAACEEDEEYKELKPCKIVEGYYTQSGKEIVERTKDISDERNSVGRDDASSRQPRQ